MKMPFGKYKGKYISELSYGYCSTLLANVPIKSKSLKEALTAQAEKKWGERRREVGWASVHDYDIDDWYENDYSGLDMGDFC